MPALKFWYNHGSQIEAILSKGNSPGGSHLVPDVIAALMPIAKKQFPVLNENNLGDDLVTCVRDTFAAPSPLPEMTNTIASQT